MGGILRNKFVWTRAAGIAGVGALLFTIACGGAQNMPAVAAQAAATQPSTPVVVSCEPNQRTLVRPVVVNGNAVSQIECVSTGDLQGVAQNMVAQPVPVNYYRPAATGTVRLPANSPYSKKRPPSSMPFSNGWNRPAHT